MEAGRLRLGQRYRPMKSVLGSTSWLRFHIIAWFLCLALFPTADQASAHGGPSGGGAQEAPQEQLPAASFLATWSDLLKTRHAIAEAIETGRRRDLEMEARQLPRQGERLLEHAGDLDRFRRNRVKRGVTQLSKVAEHLQAVANSAGESELRADLTRIDRALRTIRSSYPGDSLPAETSVPSKRHRHRSE